MVINIGISISFFIVLVILAFVYFFKEKIDSLENKIFKRLIPITLFGLLIEALIYYLTINGIDSNSLLISITIRLLYIYYVLWMFHFVIYGFVIFFSIDSSVNKKYKKFKTIAYLLYFVFLVLSIVLPIDIKITDTYLYPHGIGTTVQYIIFSFGMTIIFFSGILNHEKLKTKESIPLIACMFLGIISVLVQYYHLEFLFIVPSHSIAVILMYFTIENPDLKLINELNVAKDAADRANNAKTDFLSSMSHEIRTPLNAIVGFSNGLLDQDLNDQTKEDVNNIITASNNLLELVNGILDISKIEAGKLEIIETNYSFDKMYNELIILTKTRIGEKPIEFRYSKDKSMPEYFYGDGNRLKQIVLNLLTNAAKYTNKGFIDFNVSYVKVNEKARFIISVSDSGLGISKENLDKLFTKFERLNVEKNTTVEGTGLGLAITKNLVEMMGGKILVDSEEGKGSKFTVIVEQGITTEEEVNKIKAEEEADKVTTNTIDAKGKKVLVVDDNALNLKVAERLLKKYDIDVETCLSGYECLDKVGLGKKYDLILMDDMMPKMNGQETFKKLKNDGNFNTPVVILTANAISGMKEQYLSFGFDDYLSKPIEKAELERVINKYLIK